MLPGRPPHGAGPPSAGQSTWLGGGRAALSSGGFCSSSSRISGGDALEKISKTFALSHCLSCCCQEDNEALRKWSGGPTAGKHRQEIKPQLEFPLLLLVRKPLSSHSEKSAQTSFCLPDNAEVKKLKPGEGGKVAIVWGFSPRHLEILAGSHPTCK